MQVFGALWYYCDFIAINWNAMYTYIAYTYKLLCPMLNLRCLWLITWPLPGCSPLGLSPCLYYKLSFQSYCVLNVLNAAIDCLIQSCCEDLHNYLFVYNACQPLLSCLVPVLRFDQFEQLSPHFPGEDN